MDKNKVEFTLKVILSLAMERSHSGSQDDAQLEAILETVKQAQVELVNSEVCSICGFQLRANRHWVTTDDDFCPFLKGSDQ